MPQAPPSVKARPGGFSPRREAFAALEEFSRKIHHAHRAVARVKTRGDSGDAIRLVENVRPMFSPRDILIHDQPDHDRARVARPVVDVFADCTLPLAVSGNAIERPGSVPARMAEASGGTLICHMAQRGLRQAVRVFECRERRRPCEKTHRLRDCTRARCGSRDDAGVSLGLRAREVHLREDAPPGFAGLESGRHGEKDEENSDPLHPLDKKQDEYRRAKRENKVDNDSMNAPLELLINNQWISTTERLPVVNPFTGETIAQAALGDRGHVAHAIAAAHAAFPKVRSTSAHVRAQLLLNVAALIEKRRDDFIATIIAEAGKPVTFAEAEVARAAMTFTASAEEARRQHGGLLDLDALPPGEGHIGLARRFPIGVVAAITPFNFPLNLVAHKVGPCLATGNTMVVKPATKTPLTALLLAHVLVEAGMPAGQVNFVTCSNEDASLMVTDERVNKVTFTGSPAVGWKLKERCGKKKITLELGGNAGVIVHADADLDAAIPAIASGAFGQAGQSCISVQRIVVHESIYEAFRTRFATHIRENVKAGDPTDRANIIGPMITRSALDATLARIEDAVRAGAKLVCGGKVTGNCLDATVIEDAAAHLSICAEEAFAPVCTLHRHRDFDEALAFINDSAFGLQAGVYTRDLHLAMHAYATLEVGGVLINQVPTFRVENMPYGGVKDSGFGREGVRYAMEEMTELKSLVMKIT